MRMHFQTDEKRNDGGVDFGKFKQTKRKRKKEREKKRRLNLIRRRSECMTDIMTDIQRIGIISD